MPDDRRQADRRIALLRGINLGAHRRVAMADLRELLSGYREVRTHLQSGNVVLASDTPPDRLARELEVLLLDGLGLDVAVLVRTRDELAEVVAHDPLADVAVDPRRHQVTFLSAEPDPQVVADLVARDVAPERMVVSGREIYAWHPGGLQRSPLAGLLTDRRLGVTATARNWNTVTKLLAMADEEGISSRAR